jgi:arabinose-5-phosphate isomerase
VSAERSPDGGAAAAALEAGRSALEHMVREVAAVADRFDTVRPALERLLAVRGRVVVTGLGKSGLVGAKLAATLASTGTPAFFVHAADALHGDAGMVGPDDLLLAISKSGTTPEVLRFAELAVARGIEVLAMTGCEGTSPLCKVATAAIDIGVASEADPFDLAPTTSTAVTLVVGDALAIALMVARGFGPADFHQHHPAGALGARLEAEAGS